jgi:hypothetical protein
VLGDQRLELGDETRMPAELDIRFDPRFERGQPRLLQRCASVRANDAYR